MKTNKGDFGYIRSQKRIRLGRTIAVFALDFVIFGIGLYLNSGDRRNIYSVIAAIGCIPGAMSLVSFIMMVMRRPMRQELYNEIAVHTEGLRVLYEIYLTTRDINIYLQAVVICGEYIMCYTEDELPQSSITFMEKHINKSVLQEGHRSTVKIFTNKGNFLDRCDQLVEKRESFEKDYDYLTEAVIKAIAL